MKLTNEDNWPIYIIGTVIFLSLVIFGFYIYKNFTKPFFDKSNCEIVGENNPRRKPVPQYVILIDQSEALGETQEKYAYNFVKDLLFNSLQDGDRISLFTFQKDKFFALEPVISLCKPQAKANPIYENPRKIKEHLENNFLIPFEKELGNQLSQSFGLESPIFEAIQSVSLSREIDSNDKGRHLIIISDLLHHTPRYSMYIDGVVDFADFVIKQEKYYKEIHSDLSGWDITIIYLLRDNAKGIQTGNKHIAFWLKFFQDANAEVSRVEKVQ